MLQTLYKMTSAGKIQQWSIWTEDNTYFVEHGQQGGKLQLSSTTIEEGKNLGKSNETTPVEQCEKEAVAMWTKKQERSGYTISIPTKQVMSPMLAKSFHKDGKHIEWPCYSQSKLDGARCVAEIRQGQVKLLSRKNKQFTSMAHIEKELVLSLSPNESIILDGELYSHDLTFQEMMSLVRTEDFKDECKQIKYHVYDIFDINLGFHDRYSKLQSFISDNPFVHTRLVRTKECTSAKVAELQHDAAVKDGYEGLMLRNKTGLYKNNGRSKDLQKFKKFQDQEFEIVDVVDGTGKFKDCAIFVCKNDIDSQTFKVTPKRSAAEKKKIFKEKKKYIGEMLTVEFFERTDGGVPRFPIGKDVRNYE